MNDPGSRRLLPESLEPVRSSCPPGATALSRLQGWLESPCGGHICLAVLLCIHAGLLAWAATRHSATIDEVAHLPAGISHLQLGRLELYRGNPHLVRVVAALPVVAVGAETDWTRYTDRPGGRPEFPVGIDFVRANGERSNWLFTLARWACIPFSLIGIAVCYAWGTELYGRLAGLMAAALWCFGPNMLAHGELITPDCAATSLGAVAAYFFWRWLRAPEWAGAVAAGLALGFAELTKMTWIILFGLWPVVWLIWWVTLPERRSFRPMWKELGQLATVLLLGLYVLNVGYAFEGTGTQLKDYVFVSEAFAGTKDRQAGNRFTESWLGEIPVPLPTQYLLGFDVQKVELEQTGRPSYLRGELRNGGWWYYYLYALAIKVPLGTWLLFGLASCRPAPPMARDREASRSTVRATRRDELFLLMPIVLLLILVSSQLGYNRHLRYILPIAPFAFLWISRVVTVFDAQQRRWWLATGAALLWSVASSLSVYPHSLAYFNWLAGGPRHGHDHLISSNIDWGQDLLYLRQWQQEHPEARPLHLAYHGFVDPQALGIEFMAIPPGPPLSNAEIANFREARQAFRHTLAKHLAETVSLRNALLDYQRQHPLEFPHVDWTVLTPESARSNPAVPLEIEADGTIIARGEAPERATYTLLVRTPLRGLTGLRLEALPDETLPLNGPGRSRNGNFVLNEFRVAAAPAETPRAFEPVPLRHPSAAFSQEGFSVQSAIDGNFHNGWGVHPHVGQPHVAIFEIDGDFPGGAETLLQITLTQTFGQQHILGRFRISATCAPGPVAYTEDLATTPVFDWTEEQRERFERIASQVDQEFVERYRALVAHSAALPEIPAAISDRIAEQLPAPGWYAISVNSLRGYPWAVFNERGARQFTPQNSLTSFQWFEPVALAGYSIYIYHITEESRAAVIRELGLDEPLIPPTTAEQPLAD